LAEETLGLFSFMIDKVSLTFWAGKELKISLYPFFVHALRITLKKDHAIFTLGLGLVEGKVSLSHKVVDISLPAIAGDPYAC